MKDTPRLRYHRGRSLAFIRALRRPPPRPDQIRFAMAIFSLGSKLNPIAPPHGGISRRIDPETGIAYERRIYADPAIEREQMTADYVREWWNMWRGPS